MKSSNNKFAYLNILRFIGAISIAIFLHWNDHLLTNLNVEDTIFSSNAVLNYFVKNSYVFTEMFYIISGFLFARIYMKKIFEDKKMSFKSFITSRYIRIFPLVIISTGVMYILDLLYYNKFNILFSCGNLKFIDVIFDMVFAGTATIGGIINPINGPLWYIGPLMICYALAYALTKVCSKYKSHFVYVIPIIISIFILRSNIRFFIINTNVARGMLSFFAGILIGNDKLLFYFNNMTYKKKIILKLSILILLIIYMYCALLLDSNQYFGGYFDIILSYSLIFFPLLIMLLYDIKIINDIGNTKIFRFLGNISFGIYIWNFPIMISWVYLIKSGFLDINIFSWKFFVANFIIHIICASISYILIENRLIKKIKNAISI